MRNKLLALSLGVSFMALTGCQDGSATTGTKTETQEKDIFVGKPMSMEYEEEITKLISQMTLEEKAGMLHGTSMFATSGVPRLGIPELTMADGPLGIREEISRDSWAPAGWDNDFATYLPAGAGLSATWNPELAHTFGSVIGAEARERNKDVLLAPAFNIIRTPLGGRTYEYFSEDPFLNTQITVPYIVGVQEHDVAACIKHYAVNNQETNRGTVDVQMDERTLREIYLPAFEAAITDAHAYSVMGAYNRFRGDYLNENEYMLQNVLRDEWGFKGIVISDWAAIHSTVKALKAGADVEMGTPGPFNEFYFADPLIAAVKSGELAEEEVDKHVRRVLRLMYNIKSIDSTGRAKGARNTEEHFQEAYNIASESVVLLKNDKNVLPLNLEGVKSIAVIGDNATKKNALGGFGAGVKTKREVTPLEGLQNRLPESVKINHAQGYLERYSKTERAKFGDITLDGPVTIDELDPKLLEEAVNAAKNSDVAIIFAGSNRDYETEASDRASLDLPFGQQELIEKVMQANPNTIVVLIAGAPFDIEDISQKSSTLVWSWFNGSEGGNALADVLLGTVNPSGKLPWTMPKKLEDSPAHATNSFPGGETATYDEGILVGYRWFDTKNVEPLYPFGYGLSYTDFEFSNARLDKKEAYAGDETIQVSVDVKNTGDFDGKEVVQLYVSKLDSKVERAAQELKGFKKATVAKGATKTVTIDVPVKELAYYNMENNNWTVEPGTYTLKLGNSSRNILQEVTVQVK
ncbi:glycoside hydrolase family 3 C-terminal domain-containing protein [Salinimicrobium xinjiangense]|uniref:glycoside hydrolase family 3 C-terminal domain-containing protein n=1 Tax=Salinimicrobium xinjiangense TaxID=438596 RepID=UPI000407F5A1|nr:glycoside hydrolase family 3 C-terminal domain-containing protein [Salinimicrobium xinjiangense]